MELPPLLAKIIAWLRAGYPEGVPEHDYIPLFALLHRKLTSEEVTTIAEELVRTGDPTSEPAIRNAIRAWIHEQPLESDVHRVSSRLAAGGWPLAEPDGFGHNGHDDGGHQHGGHQHG
ncbi:MAG TPA: DUF3349 domain-containing protein [Pseudonocardiaceae bacterium]